MVWFFERGPESLTLDVCRNAAAYEVHVRQPDGTRTLEFSGEARQLVEQINAIPHVLIAAGWRPCLHLDLYPPCRRAGTDDES